MGCASICIDDDLLVHSSVHSEIAAAFAGAECSHNWCLVWYWLKWW